MDKKQLDCGRSELLADFVSSKEPAPSDLSRLESWHIILDSWLRDGQRPLESCRALYRPHRAARMAMDRLEASHPAAMLSLQSSLAATDHAWRKWDAAGRGVDSDEPTVAMLLGEIDALADRLAGVIRTIREGQGGSVPSTAVRVNPDAYMTASQLAEALKIENVKAMRARLDRWRAKHPEEKGAGWRFSEAKHAAEAAYMYRVRDVLDKVRGK